MDTRRRPKPTVIGKVPSMEPWPFSHGYEALGRGALEEHIPSMEPWPFSHGYALSPPGLPGIRRPSMEPWPFSHGYVEIPPATGLWRFWPSMEPWPFSHGYLLNEMGLVYVVDLQWSHGPSAMDTRRSDSWSWRRLSAFNGAMALQPWIPGRRPCSGARYSTFNGAMALQPWIRFDA